MDNLLRAIRKDLGNSNRGLQSGDLFKLYLKADEDIDSILYGDVVDKGQKVEGD